MPTTNHHISVRKISFLACVLCLLTSVFTQAQSTNYTKSTADSNLRGNLEVDPSTLGMSFNLPMGGYGGRGATLPISLTYSSKVWRMDHTGGFPGFGYYVNQLTAKYAEKSTAGWTSSTAVPYIEYTGSEQPYDQFGSSLCFTCNPAPSDTPFYVARVLVHLPDGSTHELRKDDNPVQSSGLSYTGVFVAVDGSRLKYDFSNTI